MIPEKISESPLWHPYTQMKTALPPVHIQKGAGAWLYTDSGDKILDLIASWWVTLHGHAHPHVVQAIAKQAAVLEQVIFAGFTHTPALSLAQKLVQILPGNPAKIFFSDNGSTAVEVALKMALQYWHNQGKVKRKILAFQNAYHGDTFGAMSVSGRSVFTHPFQDMLFETLFLPCPEPDMLEQSLEMLHSYAAKGDIAAFIFEPLLLGSGGMIMYSPKYLDAILRVAKTYDILLIADEVLTGFGRTGSMFAMDSCEVKPDMICLSKGLTAGFMPMGITSARAEVYAVFHQEDRMKTLFHGHSFTANPLACAAALANLEIFEQEQTLLKIDAIAKCHESAVTRFQNHPGVQSARYCGVVFALTIADRPELSGYLSHLGPAMYAWFLNKGLLLRPLGNVLYILPPYCITADELRIAYDAIEEYLDTFKD